MGEGDRELSRPVDTVRSVEVPETILVQILQWARAQRPREACGLLIGHHSGSVVRVELATDARNLEARKDRFRVHPEDQLAAHLMAEAADSSVIGAWHSHPVGPPIPSDADHRGAHPGSVQLIAGTGPSPEAVAGSVTAWFQEGRKLHPCKLTQPSP